MLVANGIHLAWTWLSDGVYRIGCLDALEYSFALNLITLVGATSYVNHSQGISLQLGTFLFPLHLLYLFVSLLFSWQM